MRLQAIEIGDLYPSAEVIGTDLSAIQAEWCVYFARFYSPLVGALAKRLSGFLRTFTLK